MKSLPKKCYCNCLELRHHTTPHSCGELWILELHVFITGRSICNRATWDFCCFQTLHFSLSFWSRGFMWDPEYGDKHEIFTVVTVSCSMLWRIGSCEEFPQHFLRATKLSYFREYMVSLSHSVSLFFFLASQEFIHVGVETESKCISVHVPESHSLTCSLTPFALVRNVACLWNSSL